MKIAKSIQELKAILNSYRAGNQSVGFVPTMGALHEGHLALVARAKSNSDKVVVSIFVNPLQFNNQADFNTYPITVDNDLRLLEREKVDVVFLPAKEELYLRQPVVSMHFGSLESVLEGEFRPGHFSGVGIVVSKLLNIVKPDVAYFGQKDLQQVAVIKAMVQDFSIDVDIQVVPTVREEDGLAMSSRNMRLNLQERKEALILFHTLNFCKNELLAGRDWLNIRNQAIEKIQTNPLARLEYLELVDSSTLEIQQVCDLQLASSLVIACFIGEVRLIDNLPIN